MTHPTCRGIVPPYLLRRLAGTADLEVAEPARRTLAGDVLVRSARAPRAVTHEPVSAEPAPSGPARRTVSDAQQRTELPGVVARAEGDPPTGDPAVDEAYDGLGHTDRLFRSAYGRNSLDGAGHPLDATVHYGRHYDNAFWDGARMVFGDGDGRVFGRFTRSLSVIGHELTHGVTQFSADLVYEGQSGALNESLSDVFGVLVEQYATGQSAREASWLIGEGLFAPGIQGRALRSMAAPGTAYDDPVLGKDPQPAHMDDLVVTEEDNGGVHINSGIPNRAFYLLATAIDGPAWESPGRLWYDVMTDPRLAGAADFAAFAELTRTVAEQRHGAGSELVRAVVAAWTGVGVLG